MAVNDEWLKKHLHVGGFDLPSERNKFTGNPVAFGTFFDASPEDVGKTLVRHLGEIDLIADDLEVSFTETSTGYDIHVDASVDLTLHMKLDAASGDLHIDLAIVSEAMQSTGVIKNAFQGLLDAVLGNPKIKSISLYANLDVGGYAWAKYGFVPGDSRDENEALLGRVKGKLFEVDAQYMRVFATAYSAMTKRTDDPTLIWDLVDLQVQVKVDPYWTCSRHPQKATASGTCTQDVPCGKALTFDQNEDEWHCPDHGEQYPDAKERKICKERSPCGKVLASKDRERLGLSVLLGKSWNGKLDLNDEPALKRLRAYVGY